MSKKEVVKYYQQFDFFVENFCFLSLDDVSYYVACDE